MRPAVTPLHPLIRGGIVVVLGLASYSVGVLAWADHLSESSQLADRQHAVHLMRSGSSYERLAEKLEDAGGDPLPAFTRAAELEPANAEYRMRAGLCAEAAGRWDLAEANLSAAAGLSRLYQPRYLLAQYYFRRQDAVGFFHWGRAAFEVAYGDVLPLFDLCWRMRPEPDWLLAHAVPARPEILRQYLAFLTGRRQWGAAEAIAGRISGSAVAADVPALLEFCDHSLADGRATRPVEVWNRLCARGVMPFEELNPANGASLTDGNFAHQLLGQGFGWRLNDTDGVISRQGHGGLRVTFSGKQEEWCGIAWQYLAVQSGRTYRLRWEFHGIDVDTPQGVCWKIYDLAGKRVAARNEGAGLTLIAPADVLVLMLSYERPMGLSRLAGTVSVAQVALGLEK